MERVELDEEALVRAAARLSCVSGVAQFVYEGRPVDQVRKLMQDMVANQADMDGVPQFADQDVLVQRLLPMGKARFSELWLEHAAAAVEPLLPSALKGMDMPDGGTMWDALCGPSEAA